jgi:hypothetical protein
MAQGTKPSTPQWFADAGGASRYNDSVTGGTRCSNGKDRSQPHQEKAAEQGNAFIDDGLWFVSMIEDNARPVMEH